MCRRSPADQGIPDMSRFRDMSQKAFESAQGNLKSDKGVGRYQISQRTRVQSNIPPGNRVEGFFAAQNISVRCDSAGMGQVPDQPVTEGYSKHLLEWHLRPYRVL
jgi:hypothetical protein